MSKTLLLRLDLGRYPIALAPAFGARFEAHVTHGPLQAVGLSVQSAF